MNFRRTLLLALSTVLLAGCGGSGNPGAIFDPNPPGSGGGGGGGGGGGVPNGPTAAPTPGAVSLVGAPTIADVSPKGANVSIETPIAVTFSESVQASTVSSTTLIVRVQGGSTLAATLSSFGGGRFWVVTPNAPLPTNRTIEVIAGTSILDLDGARLVVPAGGIVGSFTTEVNAGDQTTPQVVASFPRDGAVNVPPGTTPFGMGASQVPGIPSQVVVVFSEPIAPSTILGDPTPPPSPTKVGFTLVQQVDPDGTGPQPPVTTPLLPGLGALLLPFSENRVWVATPVEPFSPGATVTVGVGPGTKNDDIVPVGVNPPFFASFQIAAFGAPTFVNLDVDPATPTTLSAAPSILNNVPTLPDGDADPSNDPKNPTFAGNFTVGVVFPAGSLASDQLDILFHDATGAGKVSFQRTAKAGIGQQNYGESGIGGVLTVLTNSSGASALAQGAVVLAVRVRRGTVASAWTVGPPILFDTLAPNLAAIGPPAEGATLFTAARRGAIYGTASEPPASVLVTRLESPVGTAIPIPLPAGITAHLLRASGSFFSLLPLFSAPPPTVAGGGQPPEEPQSAATILLADAAGNTSVDTDPSPTVAGTPIRLVHRGRMAGPALSVQDALTVVVYDEQSLALVPTAFVLLDAATPSGRATNQLLRAVAPGPTGGIVAARFVAGVDFPAATGALTITASAPNYDITTIVAATGSFVSIPIRRMDVAGFQTDPSLTYSVNGSAPGSTISVAANALPRLSDRLVATSTSGPGGIPLLPSVVVAPSSLLFLSAYALAGSSFSFTYLNDGFTFPSPPLVASGASAATISFGQSFSQTTDTGDDPVPVPPAGGIPVTLPGLPLDSAALVGGVESGLFAPGSLVGVRGQISVGAGRAGQIVGDSTTLALSFDPKANAFLFDGSGGTVQPAPLDPNSDPTTVRAHVRVEDTNGNVSRVGVRTTTSGGAAIAGITLPTIPQTLPETTSGAAGLEAPKVRWSDTVTTSDSLSIVELSLKSFTPLRRWTVFVRRDDADLSVVGQVALQLPSLVGFAGSIGTQVPAPGTKLDQRVGTLGFPGLDFLDFFFDDLHQGPADPSDEDPVTFARGRNLEITF